MGGGNIVVFALRVAAIALIAGSGAANAKEIDTTENRGTLELIIATLGA